MSSAINATINTVANSQIPASDEISLVGLIAVIGLALFIEAIGHFVLHEHSIARLSVLIYEIRQRQDALANMLMLMMHLPPVEDVSSSDDGSSSGSTDEDDDESEEEDVIEGEESENEKDENDKDETNSEDVKAAESPIQAFTSAMKNSDKEKLGKSIMCEMFSNFFGGWISSIGSYETDDESEETAEAEAKNKKNEDIEEDKSERLKEEQAADDSARDD